MQKYIKIVVEVLNLKDTLNLIGPLRKALDSSKSTIFRTCYEVWFALIANLACLS